LIPFEGVDRDDVERRPVDALERYQGVRHLPAEPLSGNRDSPGEECIDARRQPARQITKIRLSPEQVSDPLLKGVAGQEPGVEQAQLGTGDEYDLSTLTADLLGAGRSTTRSS
jgi:hypothetical protein